METRVRVKSKTNSKTEKHEKRETVVDSLPLFSKCRFHAAQLITEQEKCVCERERDRERRRKGGHKRFSHF